ncbi:MAG: TIGR04255 family protein [Pirellulaceae bacterium]|nr:TIGR04255 family protein [Pirellulaceae bacterium]
MEHRELKNKPLVEAMLEIRWQLEESDAGEGKDPHYKLLLGRLFDRLQPDYPEHEQLPTATIPDELVGHVVQHRFRIASNEWPLVQIGPGILTVNETTKYQWHDFQQRIQDVFAKFKDAHPKFTELNFQSLALRYIDAIVFDYSKDNVFDFWRNNLKSDLRLPSSLFSDTGVDELPVHSNLQTTFRCHNPSGVVKLNLATGQQHDNPAIIMDTAVISAGGDLPSLPTEFSAWINSAHEVASDWFFKLIAGDLERRFTDE